MADDITDRAWRKAAQDRRAAIEAFGIRVPRCLRGEDDACGLDDLEHLAAYVGTLMALTQWEMFNLSAVRPERNTNDIVAEVFADQCCVLQPEAFSHIELPVDEQFARLAEAVTEHLAGES